MRRISLDAFCRLVGDLAEQAMYESFEHAEALTERLGSEVDPEVQENILWEMQRLLLFALFDACAEFSQKQEMDFVETMRRLSQTLLERYGSVLVSLEVDEDEIGPSRLQTQARLAEYDQALRSKGEGGPAVHFSRVAAKSFFGPTISKQLFEQFGEFVVAELGVYTLYGKQLREFRRKFQSFALPAAGAV